MNKPLKTASLAQALEAHASGTFVYNNPCCICKKECSTPTKEIWLRRINEFGGVQQMYREYKCRNCRKTEPLGIKAAEPLHNIVAEPCIDVAPAPLQMQAKKDNIIKTEQNKPIRIQPKPGDPVKAPANSIGISIWETNNDGEMEYRGTQWAKIFNNSVEQNNK